MSGRIALFRSVVRLVAKLYAREAEDWLSTRAPAYLSTARGRRVGDAVWREQVWAALQVEAGRCAAKASVDITQAFEHVDRRMLLEEAVALGYLPSALVAALDTYVMKRRSVFRERLGPEMRPLRGIVAGSAFATRKLFLVMARALGRLAAQHRVVLWSVQVDDVAATILGEDSAAV